MGCISAGGAHTMPHFTKKEKSNSSHLLQHDKSSQRGHFQIIQTPPTHSNSTLHRKQWVLVLFTQQTCAQQLKDCWQQPRHVGNKKAWWKANGHVHSSPKRTQGVAPTAQTREEATLLMLIWLEECGLVEGSQFQDLGNHGLLSLGLLGDTVTSLWKPSHKRHA